MKAKNVGLLIALVIIVVALMALQSFAGVTVTGRGFFQLLWYLCVGFAGVFLWELGGNVK